MTHVQTLAECFDYWRQEGERLAGTPRDVVGRALTYRQIYRDSGGNHAFPLIAAHGACWSRGYFAWGSRLGWWLSWQFALSGTRRKHLSALERFTDVFRDINRRVCADTYANYHFTREHWDNPEAARFVPSTLWQALCRLHSARRAGREFTTAEKRELFVAHFLNEQEHVVGPTLTAAVAEFDWPLLLRVALCPSIRFAYFDQAKKLAFKNFANREERIEQGLKSFEWAVEAGWVEVENQLREYRLLPDEAFENPDRCFEGGHADRVRECSLTS